ncbi:MAG: GGDEF domain-containing protein [Nannocystaceae bacterium]
MLAAKEQWRTAAAALGIIVVGALDWVTGTELRVFPLYFLPISLGAWGSSRRIAQALAALATAAWMTSNVVLSGGAHWSILAFNSVMQAASFSLIAHLIAELRRRLGREEALSRSDPLTGLANRRAFEERAEVILAIARRQPRPLTLALLDLDNFKVVNDTRGHDAGDEVLRAVARALRDDLRASDVLARLGGDEFAVLLPDTDAASARRLLERVRSAVAEAMRAGGWPVSVSLGALSLGGAPPELPRLLDRADALMYEAKRRGKDRLEITEDPGPEADPRPVAVDLPLAQGSSRA